jgi:hypothetical protein
VLNTKKFKPGSETILIRAMHALHTTKPFLVLSDANEKIHPREGRKMKMNPKRIGKSSSKQKECELGWIPITGTNLKNNINNYSTQNCNTITQ